ncbi:MAG: hypothetical protein Q7T08_10665 [Devosia sp.]|nr:hypothetical protein [Devosia sp.]
MPAPPKYTAEVLLPMFRRAATLRNEMRAAGFTDNGGAIHSAERILDILGQRLCYPRLSHIAGIRSHPNAEFTEAALAAHRRGEKVRIEHVAPLRALTMEVIALHADGRTDDELLDHVRRHYRLVLLTAEETQALNHSNRSKMDADRIAHLRVVRPGVSKSGAS